MPDLWIFALLTGGATIAAIFIRLRFRESLRVGIGGPEEDLGHARQLYRRIAALGAVFLASAGMAMFLGFRGAPIWRETSAGQTILNIVLIVTAFGFVRSCLMTSYQQWSPKGSFLGVWRETLFSFVTGGFLVVAMIWRGI